MEIGMNRGYGKMIEWIKSTIENPILLSIITGLITFVITWPINNWLTKRTSKKEYYDKLDACNKQIIQLCEEYVLTFFDIEEKILEGIIKGVCDENKVNIDDAYSIQSVKAILIKNFVNMRLISVDYKKAILQNLCVPDKNLNDKTESQEVVEKIVHVGVGTERGSKFITAAISLVVSVVSFSISLLSISEIENNFFSTTDSYLLYVAMILCVLGIIVVIEMALVAALTFKKKSKKSGDKIERNEISSKCTDVIESDHSNELSE